MLERAWKLDRRAAVKTMHKLHQMIQRQHLLPQRIFILTICMEDTAKENASVVDSSVTEWKQDMGNSDDPGKLNDEGAFCFDFPMFILKLVRCKLFVQKLRSLHWI